MTHDGACVFGSLNIPDELALGQGGSAPKPLLGFLNLSSGLHPGQQFRLGFTRTKRLFTGTMRVMLRMSRLVFPILRGTSVFIIHVSDLSFAPHLTRGFHRCTC
jgi:hypothetical protein